MRAPAHRTVLALALATVGVTLTATLGAASPPSPAPATPVPHPTSEATAPAHDRVGEQRDATDDPARDAASSPAPPGPPTSDEDGSADAPEPEPDAAAAAAAAAAEPAVAATAEPAAAVATSAEPSATTPLVVVSPAPSSTVESADGTVLFRGTGQPGASVVLVTGTQRAVVNARVAEDGTWQAAGWLGHQRYVLTSYYTAPDEATVRGSYDLVVVDPPVPLVVDRPVDGSTVVTDDGRVAFSGTGRPGARAIVVAGNGRQVLNVPVLGDRTWRGTGQLAFQRYDLTTRHVVRGRTETTGTVSVVVRASETWTFAVTSPAQGAVVTAPDGVVDVRGDGAPGAVVVVTDASGAPLGHATVGWTGIWTVPVPLGTGPRSLRLTHELPGTAPVTIGLDLTVRDGLVVRPFRIDSPADGSTVAAPDNVVVFEGQGAARATVELVNAAGRVVVRTTVKDDGTWRAVGRLGWQTYALDYLHAPRDARGERAEGALVVTVAPR
ncbi:hypothetical protein IFT77_12660 [Frigoribacterium sp. CFBP 13729]|uniref:hypothetical protein n=1 Tax=Frigoribacterium sp. CFBP 13729 TaxID=2775293 RepID=UPI0017807CB0|nr:hypothetical protein [Frigoribacterium sp. CFBP 13729]MBD8611336.1 hypothetical protein [Frigoribacterium sp. CFBP 13729]